MNAEAGASQERDIAILREKIRQSAEAFNTVNPDAIIASYARDVVTGAGEAGAVGPRSEAN